MKTTKKLLVTLLVLTFVLGTFTTGFAATATTTKTNNKAVGVEKLVSDIEDKNVKEAVLRLNAFGIIDGMGEDGKYHPEMKVTREQFAKILVTSLKMDTAAKAGQGYKSFKDVPADRWSAGYINVAAGQGMIKGYPDGTFKPTKEVSYAEAVTMLVRALGYKDAFLSGNWPGNYLAKAAEKDITKKVKFNDAKGQADRGSVAILVNNTLDAEVVNVQTYEGDIVKYKESDKTLLEDKLNIVKLEDRRVIANKRINDGLNEDEVTVSYKESRKDNPEKKDYYFLEDVNPEIFLGEEVTIYLNDDDEIVYIERENDDKAYFDYIKEVKNKKLDLVKADDDFELDEDAEVYTLKDGKYKATTKLSEDLEGKVGKFVIKNRKIVYAEIMENDETAPWFVVMKNNDGMLTGVREDDDEFELDLTKDGNFDDVIVLDIEGKVLSVDDIEEGNLVYAQKQSYDGDDVAVVRVVTDNIVKGNLDRVKDDKIVIGKDSYKVVKHGKQVEAYYSINDGDDIRHYDMDEDDVKDDMEDADDKEVIAFTDAVGRIAYFVTEAKATSGYKYGIVTKTYYDGEKIKVYTVDEEGEGDEVIYHVEEDDDIKKAKVLNKYGLEDEEKSVEKVEIGSIIKFKLNNAGEIADGKLYKIASDVKAWALTDDDNDFGKDYLPEAENGSETINFSIKSDATIINANSYGKNPKKIIGDTDDYNVVKWEKLAKSTAKGNEEFFVFCDEDNTNLVKAVIFIGDGVDNAAFDEKAIYVIDKWSKGGDTYVSYREFGSDKVEEKILDNDDNKYFENNGAEHPYIAKAKSNGKLEIVELVDAKNNPIAESDDGFSIICGKVSERKSGHIRFEDGKVINVATKDAERTLYNISNKTVVYEEDSKKSTSNIKTGDYVLAVVEKGSNIRVIERLIDSEKEDAMELLGEEKDNKKDNTKDEEETTKGEKVVIVGNKTLTTEKATLQLDEEVIITNKEGKVESVAKADVKTKITPNMKITYQLGQVNKAVVAITIVENAQ